MVIKCELDWKRKGVFVGSNLSFFFFFFFLLHQSEGILRLGMCDCVIS